MKVRFDWPDDMVATYNSLIGAAPMITAAIGSIMTGRLLVHGRRNCLLAVSLFSFIGIPL
jgi:hypothetical protein